jgi:methylated-DNA-[protein]-cysteine S-methyltransferase
MPKHIVDSPLGPLTLVERGGALAAINFGGRIGAAAAPAPSPLLAEAAAQLAAYFAGARRDFDLPLAMEGSAHHRAVWAAMARIPYGRTASYGDLARETGSAPRAVGAACGANPIPIVVPCHRVLAAGGGIGGYSGRGGAGTKRALLKLEGAVPERAAQGDLFAA